MYGPVPSNLCVGSGKVCLYLQYSVTSYCNAKLTQIPGITIRELFGDYCEGDSFHHDEYIAKLASELKIEASEQNESQRSNHTVRDDRRVSPPTAPENPLGAPVPMSSFHSSQATTDSLPNASYAEDTTAQSEGQFLGRRKQIIDLTLSEPDSSPVHAKAVLPMSKKRAYDDFAKRSPRAVSPTNIQVAVEDDSENTGQFVDSQESSISAWRLDTRQDAFNAMLNQSTSCGWNGLLSTTNNHAHVEEELGET